MTPLAEILKDRIGAAGPIPFRDFMEAALYHPEHGYYRSSRPRIGREGDFFTSSHVHPAFGELIAVQIREMAGHRRDPAGPFWVIEAGPGEGHLAADLWRGLGAGHDAAGFRLGLIEPGREMRRVQQQRLAGAGDGGTAEWWDSLEAAAAGGRRDGCMVANELLDAMPVHRVVMRDGRLREIFVGVRQGKFVEIEADPSTGAIDAYLEAGEIRLIEGQQAEVNLEALEWIRTAAGLIRSGYLLIIDYGHPAADLYAPVRFRGTLMSYHRHRASEDFYEDVGERDLTAHVDFTAVERAAAAAGWAFCGRVSQMEFLISLGILDRMEALAERTDPGSVRTRLALRQLIQPGGMGEVFKVLVFRRGGVGGDLRGLRNPFREDGPHGGPRIG